MVRILVISGDDPQVIQLGDRPVTIGRGRTNDIHLKNKTVSELHARIFPVGHGTWQIKDLGSSNGTFVNRKPVTISDLSPKSSIHCGGVELRFDDGPAGYEADAELDPSAYETFQILPQSPPSIDPSSASELHTGSRPCETLHPADRRLRLAQLVGERILKTLSVEQLAGEILEIAIDQTNASKGSICLFNEDLTYEPLATRGMSLDEPIRMSRTVLNRLLKDKSGVLIKSVQSDAGNMTSLLEMSIESTLCVPLWTTDSIMGFISLDQVGLATGFTSDDLGLVIAIAHQAAVGIERSRLAKEAERAADRISVLLEVAQSLSSELDTLALIEMIMQRARELLNADRCTLFLLDEERGELWSKVATGTEEIRIPMNAGVAGHVASTGEVLNIPDVYQDAKFNRKVDQKTGYRTRNLLCMPIQNNEGRIIGVTQVLNKNNGPFDKDDEMMLQALSAQAAVALENAMLFQRTLELSNYLQSVLQSITNLVLTLDDAGKLATANRDVEPFFGRDVEFMRSHSCENWFNESDSALLLDIQKVYKHPTPIYVPDYDLPGAIPPIAVNYNVVPLMDFEGAQKGVVIVLEDITRHKRVVSTLARYMSPALAHRVLDEGEERLGGLRQKVSVLFSDIRGYATITESMDATEVVEMLNEYFSVMVDAVFSENGILDKYIGDAIMAVFGVPFPTEEDSKNACRSALKMCVGLEAFNKNRLAANLKPLQIGIGINSDSVVSGNIGSEKRLEYTCIGDGVNLASRLEGATKTYGVTTLISQFTLEDIGSDFVTRELDMIRVMGKQKSIRIYELVCEDVNELSDGKLRVLGHYESGLAAYRARRWEDARKEFQQAVELGDDRPAKMFLERCLHLQENPPPKDWDGVWGMKSK